jgi:hypothetical protein
MPASTPPSFWVATAGTALDPEEPGGKERHGMSAKRRNLAGAVGQFVS